MYSFQNPQMLESSSLYRGASLINEIYHQNINKTVDGEGSSEITNSSNVELNIQSNNEQSFKRKGRTNNEKYMSFGETSDGSKDLSTENVTKKNQLLSMRVI